MSSNVSIAKFTAAWRRVHGDDATVQDLGSGRAAASSYGWRDVGVYDIGKALPVLNRYPEANEITVEQDTALVHELEEVDAWVGWLDGEVRDTCYGRALSNEDL